MYKPGVHTQEEDHLQSNWSVTNEEARHCLAYIVMTEPDLLLQWDLDQVKRQHTANENTRRFYTALLSRPFKIPSAIQATHISPQHTQLISQFFGLKVPPFSGDTYIIVYPATDLKYTLSTYKFKQTGSHQKKLTNPTPEGFRGYSLMFVGGMFVGGMWHDSSRW